MALADTAMQFWLRYVDHVGGLWENAGDSTVVVLPEQLHDEYGQSDDIRVTADPDVAREDGATLLLAGHPWALQAAESVVAEGDCGLVQLPRPTSALPAGDQLLLAARDQFPVDHGRIDTAGGATPGVRPLIRVGALVSYAVSSDVTFSEQLETWIDVASCLEVADEVVARLARLVGVEHAERNATHPSGNDLRRALRHADERFHSRADERASVLARQVADDRERELKRATDYYAAALQSQRGRLESAAPERRAMLTAKMESTKAERDRRLAEIAEKYAATHTIVPFRLHVIAVPVLRLPVDVRRGDRRYPLTLDWLLPARRFAAIRCPSCRSTAPLVAAKTGLGCQACLRKPEPIPIDTGSSAAGSAQQVQTAAKSAASKPTSSAKPTPTPEPTPALKPKHGQPSPSSRSASTAGRRRPSGISSSDAESEQRAIQKDGHRLFTSLWERTAADDRRVQRLYAPNSPAAAMHTLFGLEAPLRAIGFDFALVPDSIGATGSAPARLGSDRYLINGDIQTTNQRYGHQLCWRYVGKAALIEELTPFYGASYWPRQPAPLYNPGGAAARRLYAPLPRPRITLDGVAAEIWSAVATYGLPVILRAITAWWRLDATDTRLAGHSPTALAAAVVRVVIYRAGQGGRYDDVAVTFQIEADAIRAAATQVQRQLRLSEDQPW